jgi:uncharacterized membrane protein
VEIGIPRPTPISDERRHTDPWLLAIAAIVTTAIALFFALPWSLEGKALAILHGLCAQQPTHTFYFGDTRLPFDARMTGIYGGFAVTGITLALRGRWRAGGLPPLWVAVVCVAFIAAMAADGLNSTLRDLGVWYAYAPHNVLRLVTGLLTGTTLAIFLWFMIAQVGYHRSARAPRPAVHSIRDLAVISCAHLVFVLLVLSGWTYIWLPLTLTLIAAAITALTSLILAFVVLLTGRESAARTTSELLPAITFALIIALLVIGGLSGGRFVLEAWMGLPTNGSMAWGSIYAF